MLQVIPGQVTPLSAIITNRENGSRTIINRKPRDLHMARDFRFGQHNPKVLLLDGHELSASQEALKKWPNAISILDAGSVRESTTTLAAKVNVLAASERFATQLTGQKELEGLEARAEAIRFLKKRFVNPKSIIVTAGEAGLSWAEGGAIYHLPAFPVREVDTTAAGDIFHGALAYAYLTQMRQEQALLFASMTAALSVTKSGGRSSIPSLTAVKEALARAH
jgi:sulfofructose kinase